MQKQRLAKRNIDEDSQLINKPIKNFAEMKLSFDYTNDLEDRRNNY